MGQCLGTDIGGDVLKDVVILPTYTRPEYLDLCLTNLALTERTPSEKEFWICQDFRENDEHRYRIQFQWLDEVIAKHSGPLMIKKFRTRPHSYEGNSFNVLESYKNAFSTDARYIYLVEDDVLVKPDFFRWHEAAQEAEPNAMCSIAYRCSRNHEARTDVVDPEAYFTTARDYASIGVCWKKENLIPLLEHATPAYYSNMDGYMLKAFPGNRFADCFSEQDGLIMRVMWQEKTFTVWGYVSRAYHMGWYGYHRPNGKRPDGFWEAKAATLRSQISDAALLKQIAPDYGDIEAFPVENVESWVALRRLQEFA